MGQFTLEQRAKPVVGPLVHSVLRSPGRPLDVETRAVMEARLGQDLSRVRVHADADAATSAHELGALGYTVGRHVVLGAGRGGQGGPGNGDRTLMAHELTHVVQQGGRDVDAAPPQQLMVGQPGEQREREANAVAAGAAPGSLSASEVKIQRQTPEGDTEEKPAEQQDAGEVIAEGIKTVAEQAADNNPKVKTVVVEPVKREFKSVWNRLGTGGQVGTVGLGVGTLGLTGGALLADPQGRKLLEGVNLAAPFTLIPYMPLSTFKYTLPSGPGADKRLFRFETGFDASELLNIRARRSGLPEMSVSVNMQWGFDPTTGKLSILGGNASLGIVPGLSLSGGAYKDILRPTPTFIGPEGQMIQQKQSLPEAAKPQQIPDVRFMLNVDLLKFNPGDLIRQFRGR